MFYAIILNIICNQSINQSIKIYQIFYNEETRNQIDPRYIPLDNTHSPKPEWFEFYPIKSFLDNNELEDNTYYGFLSPRFYEKTGVSAEQLIAIIQEKSQDNIDVFLSSLGFGSIAYYQNSFEQGEVWHPGLKELSQQALNKMGVCINLDELVSSSYSTAYCNYIIGNKRYWHEWKILADKFYNLVENDTSELGETLRAKTSYHRGETAMRTFIQERLPSIILALNNFRTISFGREIHPQFLEPAKYEMCNYFKSRYTQTKDPLDLLVYKHIRHTISISTENK